MTKILKVPKGEPWYFGYIYRTTNLVNGKMYIGKRHGYFNPKYLGSGKLIKQAVDKYGPENFKVEQLCLAYSREELLKLEEKYIEDFDAVNDCQYYNIESGGYGTGLGFKGKHHTEEAKEKLRQANLGSNNAFYGKHHSEESKIKIASRKYTRTDEASCNRKQRRRAALKRQQILLFGYNNKRLPRVILTSEELSNLQGKPLEEIMQYYQSIKGRRCDLIDNWG